MNRISRAVFSAAVVAVIALACGCQSKPLKDQRSGDTPQVNIGLRPGATWPVTRYRTGGTSGEVCDFAISGPCYNASGSSLKFGFHNDPNRNLLELTSGIVVVQGTFPDQHPLFPVPWPIVITTRVSIGSEGTTFGVYTDLDSNGKAQDIIFLYDGGPLEVETRNAQAPDPNTTFPPGDIEHRKLFYSAGQVIYVKAYYNAQNKVEITEPKKLDPAEITIGNAFQCVDAIRKAAKLDQPMPPSITAKP